MCYGIGASLAGCAGWETLKPRSPTCGCSEEIEALHEEIGAKEVAHTAAIDALNQNLEAVYKYVGMTPPVVPGVGWSERRGVL